MSENDNNPQVDGPSDPAEEKRVRPAEELEEQREPVQQETQNEVVKETIVERESATETPVGDSSQSSDN